MSRLLVDLADEERERVRRVLAACPAVELPAGRAVGAAELSGAALLVVEDGVVLVATVAGHAGRRMIQTIAAPGAVLVPPSGAEKLHALESAQLTALTPKAKRALLLEPGAAAAIVAALIEAIRDREESLVNVARSPHAERVRGKLLQLARTQGKVRVGGVVIDLPLTHDLIAESIGSTRETVTLALRELTAAGFVSRVGRGYRLSVSPDEIGADR